MPPHHNLSTLVIIIIIMSLLSISTATELSLSQTLSSLGFHELAAAAAIQSRSATWHGPITLFAPTQSSLSTCPSCSISFLLQELSLPGLFPLPYLNSLLSGTKIETLSPGKCLSLTHSNSPGSVPKVFVNGVEITKPNYHEDNYLIVHVIQGYVTHLSPQSCSLERMTSLSFLPTQHGLNEMVTHSNSPPVLPPHNLLPSVMHLMLKDAMFRLRLSGYSILSIALRIKSADLGDLESFTVFALDDVSIFESGGHAFVTDFKFHIVPNRLILAGDLDRLPPGTVLRTMQHHRKVVVTASGGGIGGPPPRLNYVKVIRPDLLFNLKIAIHGVSMPFPHVNVTAAIATSRNEGPRYDDVNVVGTADAAVGYSLATPRTTGTPNNNIIKDAGIKWTAEIEDHHGL